MKSTGVSLPTGTASTHALVKPCPLTAVVTVPLTTPPGSMAASIPVVTLLAVTVTVSALLCVATSEYHCVA